jgi:hypothetical protein
VLLEWGVRLVTILALLTILGGLLILALPDTMEGQLIIRLDKTHSIHKADLIGAALVGAGALMTWAAVLAWQRRRIQQ